MFYPCSSAVAVLRGVQDEISQPQHHNRIKQENISSTLSRYNQLLLDARESLNTATSHSSQTHHLLKDVQRNLQEFTVSRTPDMTSSTCERIHLNSTLHVSQVSRNNVSHVKQEVETQTQDAQDLLTDALDTAENMSNGTAVSGVSIPDP